LLWWGLAAPLEAVLVLCGAEPSAVLTAAGGTGNLATRLLLALLWGVGWAADFVTPRRVGFGLLSLAVFAGLTAACYAAYGWTFLYETYLYHLVRRDNRHNFSPYFYDLYLHYDQTAAGAAGAAAVAAGAKAAAGAGAAPMAGKGSALVSFLPQFGTLLALGARYHRDLPMALFLQTIVFVAWNKVITVQVRGNGREGERRSNGTGLGRQWGPGARHRLASDPVLF
jgi:hypothetical protein